MIVQPISRYLACVERGEINVALANLIKAVAALQTSVEVVARRAGLEAMPRARQHSVPPPATQPEPRLRRDPRGRRRRRISLHS